MSNRMVTLMRGVPGSGKSTWAREQNFDHIISADDYFIADGEYQFDPSKIAVAHADCFSRFHFDLDRETHNNICVDNTFCQLWEISPYVMLANSYEYDVRIVEVEAIAGLSSYRLAERNSHGVSASVIEAMYICFVANEIPPFWNATVIEIGPFL